MKRFRLISTCAFLAGATLIALGNTRCPSDITPIPYHSLGNSHIAIPIAIDGSGPYEFMIDTGAQISVMDPALADKLKLDRIGSAEVFGLSSYAKVPVDSAAVVQAGPVFVKGLQMAVEELGSVHAEHPKVRGILGANFLTRFDFLIDYGREVLCFDSSGRMQESVEWAGRC